MVELFEQLESRSYARGREQGRLEGILETLTALVDSGLLSSTEAAKMARLTLSKSSLKESFNSEKKSGEPALSKDPVSRLHKPGRRPPKGV